MTPSPLNAKEFWRHLLLRNLFLITIIYGYMLVKLPEYGYIYIYVYVCIYIYNMYNM